MMKEKTQPPQLCFSAQWWRVKISKFNRQSNRLLQLNWQTITFHFWSVQSIMITISQKTVINYDWRLPHVWHTPNQTCGQLAFKNQKCALWPRKYGMKFLIQKWVLCLDTLDDLLGFGVQKFDLQAGVAKLWLTSPMRLFELSEKLFFIFYFYCKV